MLICDESVSMLDAEVQADVLALLRELQQELGLAIVFITHDLSVASGFCHRVMVLDKGREKCLGTASSAPPQAQISQTQRKRGPVELRPSFGRSSTTIRDAQVHQDLQAHAHQVRRQRTRMIEPMDEQLSKGLVVQQEAWWPRTTQQAAPKLPGNVEGPISHAQSTGLSALTAPSTPCTEQLSDHHGRLTISPMKAACKASNFSITGGRGASNTIRSRVIG